MRSLFQLREVALVDSVEAWYDGEPYMTVADICEELGDTVIVREPQRRVTQDFLASMRIPGLVAAFGAMMGGWIASGSFYRAVATFVAAWLLISLTSFVARFIDSFRLHRILRGYYRSESAFLINGKEFFEMLHNPMPGSMCVFKWYEVATYLEPPDGCVFTIGGQKSIVFFEFAEDHDRVMFALSR